MTNGTVVGKNYGIFNNSYGNVTVSDGVITSQTYAAIYNKDKGTVNISKGTITGQTNGIYNHSNGTIIVSRRKYNRTK